MHEDLGSYAYVQRVYNANMRLAAYKLPRTAENGTVTLIADELINLTMQIENGRVKNYDHRDQSALIGLHAGV